jgi:hypothetical protein
MKRIEKSEFEEARDLFMGWCTTCEAFTREQTEPDAEGYDCPVCEGNTVIGAEDALMMGKFSFNEGGEGHE